MMELKNSSEKDVLIQMSREEFSKVGKMLIIARDRHDLINQENASILENEIEKIADDFCNLEIDKAIEKSVQKHQRTIRELARQ